MDKSQNEILELKIIITKFKKKERKKNLKVGLSRRIESTE